MSVSSPARSPSSTLSFFSSFICLLRVLHLFSAAPARVFELSSRCLRLPSCCRCFVFTFLLCYFSISYRLFHSSYLGLSLRRFRLSTQAFLCHSLQLFLHLFQRCLSFHCTFLLSPCFRIDRSVFLFKFLNLIIAPSSQSTFKLRQCRPISTANYL